MDGATAGGCGTLRLSEPSATVASRSRVGRVTVGAVLATLSTPEHPSSPYVSIVLSAGTLVTRVSKKRLVSASCDKNASSTGVSHAGSNSSRLPNFEDLYRRKQRLRVYTPRSTKQTSGSDWTQEPDGWAQVMAVGSSWPAGTPSPDVAAFAAQLPSACFLEQFSFRLICVRGLSAPQGTSGACRSPVTACAASWFSIGAHSPRSPCFASLRSRRMRLLMGESPLRLVSLSTSELCAPASRSLPSSRVPLPAPVRCVESVIVPWPPLDEVAAQSKAPPAVSGARTQPSLAEVCSEVSLRGTCTHNRAMSGEAVRRARIPAITERTNRPT
eukprot:scaffold66856_cov29-Tisochrysis_lutea.AAC.2